MSKLTDAAAEAIEQRANAATEGPWEPCQLTDDTVVVAPSLGGDCDGIATIILPSASPATAFGMDRRIRTANGDFIAAARSDIPALLADRRALRAELAAVTADVAAYAEVHATLAQEFAAMKERMLAAESALAAREVEVGRLREASVAFLNKMRTIENDSRYQTVWTMFAMHGGRYDGPTYIAERDELEAALTPPPNTEPRP